MKQSCVEEVKKNYVAMHDITCDRSLFSPIKMVIDRRASATEIGVGKINTRYEIISMTHALRIAYL